LTPISNVPGRPPRFTKDVGRAVALWWLAREQSPLAAARWLAEWRETLAAIYPTRTVEIKGAAHGGLTSLSDYLGDAHAIALNSLLAPHGTTLVAWRRANASLLELIEGL
jgi:hypothetical protein